MQAGEICEADDILPNGDVNFDINNCVGGFDLFRYICQTECNVLIQDCSSGMFCNHAYDNIGHCETCDHVDCENASEDQWSCCLAHSAECNPTSCPEGLTCTDGTCCDADDWDCCGTGEGKYLNRLYCPADFVMCSNKYCGGDEEFCFDNGGVMYQAELCSTTTEPTTAILLSTSTTTIDPDMQQDPASCEDNPIIASNCATLLGELGCDGELGNLHEEAAGILVKDMCMKTCGLCENSEENSDGGGNSNDNSCFFAFNGQCDVGGLFPLCSQGTDCIDCGDCDEIIAETSTTSTAATLPSSTTTTLPSIEQGHNNDSCFFALNGQCDVGGLVPLCFQGTDCTDCGDCDEITAEPSSTSTTTTLSSAEPSLPVIETTSQSNQGGLNDDSCVFALDGECDTYGPLAFCSEGTDCTDCGNCDEMAEESSSSWVWTISSVFVSIMFLF